MNNCPKCGAPIHKDLGKCLVCDWVDPKKKKSKNLCPECGEPLVRGGCYRCGYRKKESMNTCPFCKQKLIKNRCERCDYTKPFAFFGARVKGIIVVAFIIIVIYLWSKWS